MAKFDWNSEVCGYSVEELARKKSFHATARSRLRKLAMVYLGLPEGSFEIRTNMGGMAVCGETTLHGEDIYVQVTNSCMGPQNGVMFRTCQGRKDYTGGRNNFAPLSSLENLSSLGQKVGFLLRF